MKIISIAVCFHRRGLDEISIVESDLLAVKNWIFRFLQCYSKLSQLYRHIWHPYYCWYENGRKRCNIFEAATLINFPTCWCSEKIERDGRYEVSGCQWPI